MTLLPAPVRSAHPGSPHIRGWFATRCPPSPNPAGGRSPVISCCTSRADAAWLSPWLQLLIKNKRGGDGWQAMHSIAAPEPLDLRALRLARMSNVEIKFSAPLGGRDLGHDSCSFQSTSLAALRCWKWEMQPRGDPSLTRLFHPRPHLGSSWFAGEGEKVPNWPAPRLVPDTRAAGGNQRAGGAFAAFSSPKQAATAVRGEIGWEQAASSEPGGEAVPCSCTAPAPALFSLIAQPGLQGTACFQPCLGTKPGAAGLGLGRADPGTAGRASLEGGPGCFGLCWVPSKLVQSPWATPAPFASAASPGAPRWN